MDAMLENIPYFATMCTEEEETNITADDLIEYIIVYRTIVIYY